MILLEASAENAADLYLHLVPSPAELGDPISATAAGSVVLAGLYLRYMVRLAAASAIPLEEVLVLVDMVLVEGMGVVDQVQVIPPPVLLVLMAAAAAAEQASGAISLEMEGGPVYMELLQQERMLVWEELLEAMEDILVGILDIRNLASGHSMQGCIKILKVMWFIDIVNMEEAPGLFTATRWVSNAGLVMEQLESCGVETDHFQVMRIMSTHQIYLMLH